MLPILLAAIGYMVGKAILEEIDNSHHRNNSVLPESSSDEPEQLTSRCFDSVYPSYSNRRRNERRLRDDIFVH